MPKIWVKRIVLAFLAISVFFIAVDTRMILAQTEQAPTEQVEPAPVEAPDPEGILGPLQSPYSQGVTGGKTIMQNSMEVTEASEKSMQKMWDEIFGDGSVMYQAVVLVATSFLGIFFLLTILPILNDTGNFNWRGVGSRFAWIAVVAVLIANDAAMLRGITIGTRDILNQTSSTILDVQVDQVTMRDALNDVIVSEKARSTISMALADCEAKEGVEQLRCFKEGAEAAEAIIKEEERWINNQGKFKPSPGIQRALSRLDSTVADLRAAEKAAESGPGSGRFGWFTSEALGMGTIDFILQSTSQAASNELLKAIQQMFVFGTEIAMILTGLLGPLAVAASLIPTTPRAVFIWMVAFLTIGFIKLTYNILIAFCALWVINAERQGSGDFVALLLMSIGAPAIAIALSGWGGISVLNSMATSAGTAISLIPVTPVSAGVGGTPPSAPPPPAPKT
jgi:hypothetical protein